MARDQTRTTPRSVVRRETRVLSDGAYTFHDELNVEETVTSTILTGTGWLVEYFEITSGELLFVSGETRVFPRKRKCWVFYPPFSLSRPFFRHLRGTVMGKAGSEAIAPAFKESPFLFESDARIFETPIADILASALNRQSIDLNPHASALSIRARKLIAAVHPADPAIGQVAARLGVSNAHLSRQFRRDYEMTPREYLHRLRMADVPLRLARGENIADVSGRAGYGDLSRFYKQFRKRTRTSPGACREVVAPRRR